MLGYSCTSSQKCSHSSTMARRRRPRLKPPAHEQKPGPETPVNTTPVVRQRSLGASGDDADSTPRLREEQKRPTNAKPKQRAYQHRKFVACCGSNHRERDQVIQEYRHNLVSQSVVDVQEQVEGLRAQLAETLSLVETLSPAATKTTSASTRDSRRSPPKYHPRKYRTPPKYRPDGPPNFTVWPERRSGRANVSRDAYHDAYHGHSPTETPRRGRASVARDAYHDAYHGRSPTKVRTKAGHLGILIDSEWTPVKFRSSGTTSDRFARFGNASQ